MENKQLTVKSFFENDNVKKKFADLLGKKAQGFITSVLQVVNSNDLLAKATPESVYNAAATAATLDLPINNNLGFAYILPYNQKQKDGSYKSVAQFQLGYKGFIQLAQRSGQFKTISATPIYEGQLIGENPLTGFEFDFKTKKSDVVIGYAAYFALLNGFEKTLYMPVENIRAHSIKYSQTAKKGFGLWKDSFDEMAVKTVLKLLLAKFAPLSIEMQKAVVYDQAVIDDNGDATYIDHEVVEVDKEAERAVLLLNDCQTLEDVELLTGSYPELDSELVKSKIAAIKNG
jgi:recombination protein RecT